MDVSDISKAVDNQPSFDLDFSDHGQIISVVFSPFEYSQEVILIQFSNKIIVGTVSFQVSPSGLSKALYLSGVVVFSGSV